MSPVPLPLPLPAIFFICYNKNNCNCRCDGPCNDWLQEAKINGKSNCKSNPRSQSLINAFYQNTNDLNSSVKSSTTVFLLIRKRDRDRRVLERKMTVNEPPYHNYYF